MNPNYKLIQSENEPYTLDYMCGCNEKVVALSKKIQILLKQL